MVQSYEKFLTYASKQQEKISFFSFYKQISMSMITCCVFQFPSRTIFSLAVVIFCVALDPD